jgi:hypothetical protein
MAAGTKRALGWTADRFPSGYADARNSGTAANRLHECVRLFSLPDARRPEFRWAAAETGIRIDSTNISLADISVVDI